MSERGEYRGGGISSQLLARCRSGDLDDPEKRRAVIREYARKRGARLVEETPPAASSAEAERLARIARTDEAERRLEESRRKSHRLAWEAKRREIDAGGR